MSMATCRTSCSTNSSNRSQSCGFNIDSMAMSSNGNTMSMCTCRGRSNSSCTSCCRGNSCTTTGTSNSRSACSISDANSGINSTSSTGISSSTCTCRTSCSSTSSSCSAAQSDLTLLNIITQVSCSSTDLFPNIPDITSSTSTIRTLINSNKLNVSTRNATIISDEVNLTHSTSCSSSSRCTNTTISSSFFTSIISYKLNACINHISNILPSLRITRAILDILGIKVIRYAFDLNLFDVISHSI